MRIVLATGIYPPAIGGPATYVRALAGVLSTNGHDVRVVTYGESTQCSHTKTVREQSWPVTVVSRSGGPLMRWWRYAKTLRRHASGSDAIVCFSAVSCGVPLALSRLRGPRRLLRLGGDFLWERYTDWGGRRSLRNFYEGSHWLAVLGKPFLRFLLRRFDTLVFSTQFQKRIYERAYGDALPRSIVIENAFTPSESAASLQQPRPHQPFRLLFLGRFVRFKNLGSLIAAMPHLTDCVLTLAGSGPLDACLQEDTERLGLATRVQFTDPVSSTERAELFASHDLLVLPSLTEISPNTALEARAAGLPVLLTRETGLSTALSEGMVLTDLRAADAIAAAVSDVQKRYDDLEGAQEEAPSERSWDEVAQEYEQVFGI